MRLLLFLFLFGMSGCAGQTVNEALRRRADRGVRSATMAAGARALLEPPRLDAYSLGALDVIQVQVLDLKEVGQVSVVTAEIDPLGQITFPLLGRVACGGETAEGVRVKITELLARKFIGAPEVAVKVLEYRSKRVAVLGPVGRPGVVQLHQNQATIVEILALAGGLSDSAGKQALLVRNAVQADLRPALEVDLEALSKGDLTQNYTVQPGDVIQVLPADRYYVTGFVTTPGEYGMRRSTSLLEAISIAGGVISPDASTDETYILRAGEPPIQCDLEAIAEGQEEDPMLVAGDLIQVRQGFWRGFGLGLYRFIKGGIGFGFNLASLIPPF